MAILKLDHYRDGQWTPHLRRTAALGYGHLSDQRPDGLYYVLFNCRDEHSIIYLIKPSVSLDIGRDTETQLRLTLSRFSREALQTLAVLKDGDSYEITVHPLRDENIAHRFRFTHLDSGP